MNHGCKGGLMDYAFEWIAEGNSLMLESDYPYTSETGKVAKCKYEKSQGVGTVSGHKDVRKSASQLKAALNKQPVSVAVEADKMAF